MNNLEWSATVLSITLSLKILVTSVSLDTVIIADENKDCLDKCHYTKQRAVCMDCVPVLVPRSVREVVLKQLQYHRLVPQGFCKVAWENVSQLAIEYDSDLLEEYNIPDYAFDCLEKIIRMKLGIHFLKGLSNMTLYGLTNVRVLDLSNCTRLETPALTNGLSMETAIPNLSTLVLRNMGSYLDGVDVSQAFIDVLGDRKIKEINLSASFVKFENITTMPNLCKHLQRLNLSKSQILHSSKSAPLPVCMSLQVVDLSFVHFPRSYIVTGNLTLPPGTILKFDNFWFSFFSSASVLYLNQLLSEDHYIFILNTTFEFLVNNSIKEWHLSGYSMPVFEVEIIFEPNHLQYLDLSHNKIETLGAKSFSNLIHLKRVDLSHNKLFTSNSFEDTFTNLFKNNSKLEEVSLVNNGLSLLPLNIFSTNNNLKYLDLSRNQFHQINFEITNLLSLVHVDLRNNSITNLNGWSRNQINLLYQRQQNHSNKHEPYKTVVIDLRDNPLSCGCQSLDFINWFIESPVFASTRELYHCQLDGQHIPMTINAVDAAKDDCDKAKRRLRELLLSTIIPSVSCGALVLVGIMLFRKYRTYNKYRRLREQIDRIQNDNCGFQFPVFLSFSSEDSDFVILNILEPLETHLKAMTGTDRDLVAMGDRHFRLGRSIFAEIIRCLEECAVLVVVLSKSFCLSEYCRLEIEQARLMRKPIVIIMKEFVDEDVMDAVTKETFKHFVRATFRSDEEAMVLQQDWEYICECIIQLL